MKGLVVTPDCKVYVKNYGDPLYITVGKTVGGDIELVRPKRLCRPYVMLVNEDGINMHLPFNPVGSYYYQTDLHGWPILGTAVFMKEGMTEKGPDLVGLTDEELQNLEEEIERLTKKFR